MFDRFSYQLTQIVLEEGCRVIVVVVVVASDVL